MTCCTQCEECATEETEAKEYAYFSGTVTGRNRERERIIKLLTELGAIRRDALGHLVAFNTDGTEVIYLEGLEK